MAVSIRLARYGKKKNAFYRVVVADSRKPRDGRFIEIVGTYDPKSDVKKAEFKKERVEYWIGQGAQPTETVSKLIKYYS
jgi:small subunit ribosomal protein S16